MTIEEKAKALAELADQYKDSPDKVAAYKENPVATLKEAGFEITQEEYEQILAMPSPLRGGKCSIF